MTGILTLDSITALLIATVILTAALGLISHPKTSSNGYLYQVSLDLLTVLEENGGLEAAVAGDERMVEEVKAGLPGRLCFQIDVRHNDTLVYTADRDCGEPEEYAVGRRSFVSRREFYIAEMRVWLR